MSAILNSLNAHNFLIFQPILMILVSKFMVYRALSDKTYLSLGLRSPLTVSTIRQLLHLGIKSHKVEVILYCVQKFSLFLCSHSPCLHNSNI